jgi:tetratricopeptide (TPR) repeat protein
MKKYLLILLCLSRFALLSAQETQVRANENHLFEEGKNLFIQQKFGAAKVSFEKFLAKANINSAIFAEANYYVGSCAYELKERDADDVLKSFLDNYPYFPMNYRVNFMLGRIAYEQGNIKQALSYYNRLDVNNLSKSEAEVYSFTKGFCLLQQKDYAAARKCFSRVRNSDDYYTDALYYSAYCDYCLKNYADALEDFETLKNSKYSQKAAFHSLQIYDQTGNSTKAVETGKELVRKFPDCEDITEAYRILGEASFKEKNYADAVGFLKKYERGEKKVQRNGMYMLGMALYYTSNYSESITYLSKTTAHKDEMSQNAYLHIGLCYLKINNPAQAKMAFQSACASDFNKKIKEEALYNYALATYESGSLFGESVKAFNQFLEEFPTSAHRDEIYNLLATACLSDKNYAAALQAINTLKNPNNKLVRAKEHILFELGVIDYYSGNYSSAINYFSQSIKLFTPQSFSAQAYLWRGETYYKSEKYAQCRSDLNTFLSQKQPKEQTDIEKACYTMGYSYFEENNYQNALEWFARFIQSARDKKTAMYYDALNRTGDCYYSKRDFNAALNNYSKVISGNGKNADYAYFQSGFIKGLQKDYSGKISDMEKVVKLYPASTCTPNAQYETGRAYVMQNRYNQAIEAYNIILTKYPKNAVARKAAVEIGMLYANMGQNAQAIEAYKRVVAMFPGSEQTNIALDGLQTLYVENNDVASYVAYRQSLGKNTAADVTVSEEDSLTFVAVEKIYAKDCQKAIPSLKNYIEKFCTNATLNCITANYYLAECYYSVNDMESALEKYDYLTKIEGNKFMEQALIRAADLAFGKKLYDRAAEYFEHLQSATNNADLKASALLGVLRCRYANNDYEQVIDCATIMLRNSNNEVREREAYYCRAKALIALGDEAQAMPDLSKISQDVSFEMGAEAKFILANGYFKQKNYQKAEEEIIDFINKKSPFQYWIARSFVLLADIYIVQKDDFQAKQYLLSLQENYKKTDDIEPMIATRLAEITKREKEKTY